MQINQHVSNASGGRIYTKLLRNQLEYSKNFQGLPENITYYDILRLIKKVGRKIGFNSVLISHLEYLLNHTKNHDWIDGGRPIIYKTVQKTALELGLSERQVNNREQSLHKLGVLVWTDFGNHRRMGKRDDRGKIIFAYGVNLSPMAKLYDNLIMLSAEQDDFEQEWQFLRRQHSAIKGEIHCKLNILVEYQDNDNFNLDEFINIKDQIAEMPPRIRVSIGIDKISDLIERLKSILMAVDNLLSSIENSLNNPPWQNKTSALAEADFRPKYYTNKDNISKDNGNDILMRTNSDELAVEEDINFANAHQDGLPNKPVRQIRPVQAIKNIIPLQKNRSGIADSGVQHISMGNALAIASRQFKSYIPDIENCNWRDITEAAEYSCHDLGINRSAWVDAVAVMGRNAAAIAVLIIDVNKNHPTHPIKSAGGVLRGMTIAAEDDKLHLHRSIFGILQRENAGDMQ